MAIHVLDEYRLAERGAVVDAGTSIGVTTRPYLEVEGAVHLGRVSSGVGGRGWGGGGFVTNELWWGVDGGGGESRTTTILVPRPGRAEAEE